MDTGFLNFNSEEHFSFDYLDQINYENGTDPASATTTWPDDDDDDLPDCGGLLFSNIKDITETLPSDFFNIDVINGESNSLPPLFDTSIRVESSVSPSSSSTTSSLSSTTNDDFDLTNYLNKSFEQTTKSSSSIITTKRTIKAPVKKIDKNACKYIIKEEETVEDDDDDDRNSNNDDLVDVCTISSDDDESNHPVLEANDPIDLLEQFELSEKSSHSIVKQLEESLNSDNNTNNNNNKNDDDNDFLDKIPPNPIQIFADDNIETIVDNKTITTTDKDDVNRRQINNNNNNVVKNQQIRDALPQELIARINESSGKRKPITVIPPIPPNNKKRCNNNNLRTFEAIQRCKINKLINQHNIMNDHDYCKIIATTTTSSGSGVYPKEPKKDSGFESAEEDDQQSQSQQQPTIRNQPIVKNEDGKLMVSLLKVNTINNTNDVCKQKKKLKLEEYKKRRPIASSQNNSPIASGCSSPLPPQQPLAPPEDENLKRIKHQEKLMRMAAELLNTPPPKVAVDKEIKQLKETPKQQQEEEVGLPQPPPDMEMKSFVSVGINTEICSDQQDLLTDIEQYDQIEPLLHKISDKINSNSFITSLIENLPKVKRKKTIQNHNPNNNNNDDSKQQKIEESVRENLVVVWLPKNRPICKMINQEIQTTITLIGEETQSRYRRRLISDTESIVSCCSSTSSRSSSSSSSSMSSSSSSSIKSSTSRRSRKRRRSRSILSQSSQSRSRSRSSRNNHKRNNSSNNNNNNKQISPEQVAEVEERRVIYVGRLEDGLNNDDLLRKFKHFGTITNASVHPRKNGESFGFVTFANKEDAYEAVEHGNDVYGYQRYDLSFGGRRIFCQTSYSDLDDMKEDVYNYQPILKENEESFDSLLRAFLALRKRKP